LARAYGGKREEALNFLDSFCFVFLIKEKNESLSGRTKMSKEICDVSFIPLVCNGQFLKKNRLLRYARNDTHYIVLKTVNHEKHIPGRKLHGPLPFIKRMIVIAREFTTEAIFFYTNLIDQ